MTGPETALPPHARRWPWGPLGISIAAQVAVECVPLLQCAFSTVALEAGDWLRRAAAASSVPWARGLGKVVTVKGGTQPGPAPGARDSRGR